MRKESLILKIENGRDLSLNYLMKSFESKGHKRTGDHYG
jgi:hypothetical protein